MKGSGKPANSSCRNHSRVIMKSTSVGSGYRLVLIPSYQNRHRSYPSDSASPNSIPLRKIATEPNVAQTTRIEPATFDVFPMRRLINKKATRQQPATLTLF